MTLLHLREPVSALSHGAGLLLSVPGTLLLWRLSRGDLGKRLSLLVYGLSMAACYGASMVFHAVRGPARVIAEYDTFDHIGIYLFIAGSYTSVGWNLLRGSWRRFTLAFVWLGAAAGGIFQLRSEVFSPLFATGLYLAMGWGISFIYFEMARWLSHRSLRPIVLGGVLYSIGAAFHVLNWPNPWPDVVGSHEVFHLFVLAGSLVHYGFIVKVVIPHEAPAPVAAPRWSETVEPLLELSERSWSGMMSGLSVTVPGSSASA